MVTPLLGLTEIAEASPLAHIIANTSIRVLEAYAGRLLQSVTLTAPPGSPAEGAIYFIATSPTGAWAGHGGELTVYVNGLWIFLGVPKTSATWDNVATGATIRWNGSAWV